MNLKWNLMMVIALSLIAGCKKDKNDETLELPPATSYGINILYHSVTSLEIDTAAWSPAARPGMTLYAMAARVPEGKSVKVRLRNGSWGIRLSPDGPSGWTFTTYDFATRSQEFTAKPGQLNNLHLIFDGYSGDPLPDTIVAELYVDHALVSSKSMVTRY